MLDIVNVAVTRAIALSPKKTMLDIDRLCMSMTGPALGVAVSKCLVEAAQVCEPTKRLLAGGLLSHMKLECMLRQKQAQQTMAAP